MTAQPAPRPALRRDFEGPTRHLEPPSIAAAGVPAPLAPWKDRDFPSTPPNHDENQAARRLRNSRLRVAWKLLTGTTTAWCLRALKDSDAGADIVQSEDGAAHLHGAVWCNLRGCPACAWRKAAEDRDRAEGFLGGWVARGSAIAMVTYTLRHKADEDFQTVWDAKTAVLDSMHSGRPWRELVAKYGLGAHMYGNEARDGANGWHIHQHRLDELGNTAELRTRSGRRAAAKRLEAELTTLYLKALHKHGRSASRKRAVSVTIAAPTAGNVGKAAHYISKLSGEVTQGAAKTGKLGSRSPWELLDDAEDKTLTPAQRARARARFAEFYYQSKQKRWVYFSEAGTEDDGEGESEVPEPKEAAGQVVLHLSNLQFRMLVYADRVCWLQELVENEGPAAAEVELKRFCDQQHWSQDFVRHKGADPPGRYAEQGEPW